MAMVDNSKREENVTSPFFFLFSHANICCTLISCSYPYIAVVLNFSQMWALYCLVKFYNVTHERLQSIKPLAKFISFKAIVFATWWQGVGIALLHTIGVLPKEGKLQTGLQDFLICIEVSCFCCCGFKTSFHSKIPFFFILYHLNTYFQEALNGN